MSNIFSEQEYDLILKSLRFNDAKIAFKKLNTEQLENLKEIFGIKNLNLILQSS